METSPLLANFKKSRLRVFVQSGSFIVVPFRSYLKEHSFIASYHPFIVSYVSFIASYVSFIAFYVSFIASYVSFITSYVSFIASYASFYCLLRLIYCLLRLIYCVLFLASYDNHLPSGLCTYTNDRIVFIYVLLEDFSLV
jgi:hypothetical protein